MGSILSENQFFSGSRAWQRPTTLRFLVSQPTSAVDLTTRGVKIRNTARARALSQIAATFLEGYHSMLLGSPFQQLEELLDKTVMQERGFVVEGAAMGAAVRDAFSLQAGMLKTLSSLHGERFEYLIAVGSGWAVARTPWKANRIFETIDPLLVPLACDGRGFHDLYFKPKSAEQGRIARYSGARAYGYDAGLGRALWFIASGHVPRVVELVNRFDADRHPDLLAGVGLAMAYAGPATDEDWATLRSVFSTHWSCVGQGICFAAEAMRRGGVCPEHLEVGCLVGLGLDPSDAASIAEVTRPRNVDRFRADGAYETWRKEIRNELIARGAA